MEDIKIVENNNNDHLGPIGGEGLLIGGVDEVNGAGATEIPEFVPTRHELVQLAKYWRHVWLDDVFFMYWTSTTSSTELRREAFARRRLNRIAESIGDDILGSAINEVDEEFGKGCDPRTWDRFQKSLPLPQKVADKYGCGQKPTDDDWEEGDVS
jgi:hypothetical protein